ncbi:MAG: Enoyl-(Acyl carrier protein) reductase [Burkholderiales bacterium]|jgi:NAD(P)-dependent dehydrogenase (short-subunit alcohol dehydrogenase family)|nr:Enoyl-(Acyl carrier protein) reductase [Burkholderiales bacterium]
MISKYGAIVRNTPLDMPMSAEYCRYCSLSFSSCALMCAFRANLLSNILFLASDNSSWLTGVTIPVDGGHIISW